MKRVLLVDSAKCTGCETCVDVCSGRKTGVYSDKASRIRVQKDEIEAVFIPLVCEQCREHPCIDVCPVNAIQYDEEVSIFVVDEDTCTGCGACEEVCPYHGIFVSDDRALKCDLCGGEPACVSVCYPQALLFVEATDEAIIADLEHKMDKLKKIRSEIHE